MKKESQKRNFGRKLNKLLNEDPDKNPLAAEIGLRGKAGNQNKAEATPEDWELVEEPGQRPYYWNKVTNETTYDNPIETNFKPPPPPPPMRLPGMMQPPPPATPKVVVEPTEVYQINEAPEESQPEPPFEPETVGDENWVYVCENEPNPYYWNIVTNETSFTVPSGFTGKIYSTNTNSNTENSLSENNQAGDTLIYQETLNENGEVIYVNSVDGSVIEYRPEGQLIVVQIDETGQEINWAEYYDEEGIPYYYNTASEEMIREKPIGSIMIVTSF